MLNRGNGQSTGSIKVSICAHYIILIFISIATVVKGLELRSLVSRNKFLKQKGLVRSTEFPHSGVLVGITGAKEKSRRPLRTSSVKVDNEPIFQGKLRPKTSPGDRAGASGYLSASTHHLTQFHSMVAQQQRVTQGIVIKCTSKAICNHGMQTLFLPMFSVVIFFNMQTI